METIYSTYATATGGRNGHVKSETGVLDADVRMPGALGGKEGDYLNPEILFAGGYAACFDNALISVTRAQKLRVITSTTAHVSLGKKDDGTFGLAVKLEINVPDVTQDVADNLVQAAHQVCPYSNATRGNIDVELVVTTHNSVKA